VYAADVCGEDAERMSMKDRDKIHEIISTMLDNPDEHGIYPTSKAYHKLEMYVITQRIEALGWCYAYCCNLLDKGADPRQVEVPELIDAFNEQVFKE
jgi:hypothetical protein